MASKQETKAARSEASPFRARSSHVYKDQAATDFHMNSPYLAALLEKAGPLLDGTPVIAQTKLIGGS
jgi:quinol monooxygenase YgiN